MFLYPPVMAIKKWRIHMAMGTDLHGSLEKPRKTPKIGSTTGDIMGISWSITINVV
jgi:hypothetical protein